MPAQHIEAVAHRLDGVGAKVKGPCRPAGTPPASRVLTVRVPEALGAALDARAQAERLTTGTVARRALVVALDGDAMHAVPVRRYRPSNPAPTLDVVALADLRHVTGELNGTVREVAGLSRKAGAVAVWHEMEKHLPRLRALIEALDDMKEAAMLSASRVRCRVPPSPEEGRL